MGLIFKSGGGNVGATRVRMRSGGGWVDMAQVRQRVSGAWSSVWTFIHSVSFNPDGISTSRANGTNIPYSVAANVSGGIGGFSYAWSWQSGGAGMTLSGTSSSTVSISASGTNVARTGTLRCIVTDNGTGQQVTKTCSVFIQFGTPV